MNHKTFCLGMRLAALQAVLIFSMTTVFAANIPLPALGEEGVPNFQTPPFLEPLPVSIPPAQGEVSEVFFPENSTSKTPFVYLIQDAHESLDAQENIRQILKTLVNEEHVQAICFEGGSLELDRKFYDFTKNSLENEKIWDELFKQGELSGLERYAVGAPRTTRFYGIENEDLYFRNLHSIRNVYENENKSQAAVREFEAALNRSRGRLLTGDLKKIHDLKKAFDKKRINLMEYARGLIRWAEKSLKLKLSAVDTQIEWPQLVRLVQLMQLEEKLKKSKVGFGEQERFMLNPESQFPDFIWDPSQHWRVKGHLRWYFERAIDQGFDPDQYPDLKDWIAFYILQDELEAPALFEELERVENQIGHHLSVSQETKDFLALEKEWGLAKKMMQLELSRSEWQEIKEKKFSFEESPELHALIEAARRNYELVEQRDPVLSQRTQQYLSQSDSKKIALVVGGFHASEMIHFFKEHHFGYAIINPAIHDFSKKVNYREQIGALELGRESSLLKNQTALPVKAANRFNEPRNRLLELVQTLRVKIKSKDILVTSVSSNLRSKTGSSLGSSSNVKRLGIRDPYWQRKFAEDDLKAAPEVLKHFDIGEIKEITPTLIGLGEHGKPLIVVTDRGKYVLKPLSSIFYREIENGARFEVSVVNELVRRKYPAAPLVPSKKVDLKIPEDQYFVKASNGKLYLLYQFVSGDQVSHRKLKSKQSHNLVDTLAKLHEEMMGFEPRGWREFRHVMNFHERRERLKQLRERILAKKKANSNYIFTRGEKFYIKNTDFLLKQLDLLGQNLPPLIYESLPKTIIHGDYQLFNIVFRGNNIAAFFDWDFLRREARLYDFYRGVFPVETGDGHFNLQGLVNFVQRYEKTSKLLPIEKDNALPEMARLALLERVLIERPLERLKYKEELAHVDPLELVVRVIDLDDFFNSWIHSKLKVLKDIDVKIQTGKFQKVLKSGHANSMGEVQDQSDFEDQYGNSLESIFKLEKLLRGVLGKDLRAHFPKVHDQILDYLRATEADEPVMPIQDFLKKMLFKSQIKKLFAQTA